jgi:ABC-type Fe3+-hydroxamate transport system substrate-binding protein
MKALFSVLLAAIFFILIFSSGSLTYSQDENATSSSESRFLSVQHAGSGSIFEDNAVSYTLELNNVSDKTILFSDRPDRIVTSINTSDFIHDWHWSIGPAKSFWTDPPNAALIGDEDNQDITIVELTNPVHDPTARTLKYDVVLENTTSTDIPNEFGQSTLVIDVQGNKPCLTVINAGC